MRKSHLYFTITIGLLIAVITSLHSCKKVNGVDNDQVVETPFSLYFSDTAGAVYNSTDGKNKNIIFEADNYPCRAICVAGNNILLVKKNLYISTNNGVNFNHSFDSVGSYPGNACNGFPLDLNQSMIIDIPSWNYLYLVNDAYIYGNYLGLSFSLYSGTQGDWYIDLPDSTGSFGDYGAYPYITITSLTLMPNGVLAGYDARHNRCFYRTKGTLWNECTANPDTAIGFFNYGAPYNHSGNQLPFDDLNSNPVDTIGGMARYSYGHYNYQLIAIDQTNCHTYGAYYSNDTGRNWTAMSGLPSTPLLCIESPFEEICLIGTAGSGLYILNINTNTWQTNNNGLAKNLIVHSITAKQMIYKNGKIQKYIFLATNAGVYQSTDLGNTWTLTIPGNFTAIY